MAGSIASREEIARLRARVPGVLHGVCDALVEVRTECPAMSFGQALDVCLPSGVRANDQWGLMSALFAYSTAVVGRARRVAVARAMQGLDVTLVGTEAWTEFATGTLRYAGNVAYAELPELMKRTKVCVAVSPPQFATGFSERVLMSMAAGCATVAEERLAIGREFCAEGGGPVAQYGAERVEMAHCAVEKLLGDGEERGRMGVMGRRTVAAAHLWDHRVGVVMTAAGIVEKERLAAA